MTAILTLQNSALKATFNTKGAELTSLTDRDIEYIWKADPSIWGKHSPILFPIVGELKDGSYYYNKKKYNLSKHGFARDKQFNLIAHTDSSILFELRQDEETLDKYPFHFVLQIKYTLIKNTLSVNYSVKNSNKKDLYFSIGAHPAFSCPFEKDQTREEFALFFDTKATPQSCSILNGLRNGEYFNVFEQKGILDISKNIFNNDALVFNPNPFNKVSFVHKPTNKTYLEVLFNNFPQLGIWSKDQNSPFVCIEPWYGINDQVNHNQKLNEKEGMIKLSENEYFHSEYQIIIKHNHE